MYSVTGEAPIKNFQSIFFKHDVKHQLVLNQALLYLIDQANPQTAKEENNVVLGVLVGMFVMALTTAFNTERGDRNPFSIESSRTAGLYLDFHKVKRKWLFPKEQIDIESFEEYFIWMKDFLLKSEQNYFTSNSDRQVKKLLESIKELQ